jgi:hypothetical protein
VVAKVETLGRGDIPQKGIERKRIGPMFATLAHSEFDRFAQILERLEMSFLILLSLSESATIW